MNNTVLKYGLWVVKAIVAAAFLAAGAAKIAGADMMVATFDAIGVGQWFRYATGAIEITCAVLIFTPGKQAVGASLLVCTMVGAMLAHFIVLGPSAAPAMALGALAMLIAFAHRDQLRAFS